MAGDRIRESFTGGQAKHMNEAAEDVLNETCAVFIESG